MKTSIKNLFLLPALTAGLGMILAGRVTAQTFKTLHSFNGNSDGSGVRGLILSGNILYGTMIGGGSSGLGTVFAVNTDGTDFTTLYNFAGSPDAVRSFASLILSGNTLYGTTYYGGSSGFGTVFAVNADGTGFTILYSFTGGSDGANPYAAALILSGNTLYGTASSGGSLGNGTVFAVNTDGTGFTNLYGFTGGDNLYSAAWILSGNTLYGTANTGGSSSNGTVFAVNTDGTGFTTLYSFTAVPSSFPQTNSDGAYPTGLILSGNTLYGTATAGGSSGAGAVFKVNTDGTGFTTLYSFTAVPSSFPQTNSDGAYPTSGLILSGNALYGTANRGGSRGVGTLFKVNTDGTGFTNLHTFTGNSGPYTGLILSGNILYGTTAGTVFSLSLPSVSAPQLTLASDGSGGYFIRARGDPHFTCRLQRAPDLSGPWDTLDTQTAPASGLIEFHDTSPLPGQAFYRTTQL